MIYIEMPLWLAIIIVICFIVLLVYFIVGDLFVRLMHEHYQLILREREVEIAPTKDPVKEELRKKRLKRRKALRQNKADRRKYRESQGEWVVPKGRKKKYNKPQDGSSSMYAWSPNYQKNNQNKENKDE